MKYIYIAALIIVSVWWLYVTVRLLFPIALVIAVLGSLYLAYRQIVGSKV